MMQLTPQMRILVCIQPADFRRGIDGLARMCRETLGADPMSGWVFVFRNRRATAIKLLLYDGQGFWLAQKRLSRGRFRHWPVHGGVKRQFLVHELQVLLAAGNPETTQAAPQWRGITAGD